MGIDDDCSDSDDNQSNQPWHEYTQNVTTNDGLQAMWPIDPQKLAGLGETLIVSDVVN